MARVSHKNICSYVDSFIANGNKLYLIMEYCDRGDLEQYMARTKAMAFNSNAAMSLANQRAELSEPKVWRFFLQICLALEVIHSQGIVHADLKPSNLLISGRDYVIKLTDFGISQKLSTGYDKTHSNAGTLPYCSPEVINGDAYN